MHYMTFSKHTFSSCMLLSNLWTSCWPQPSTYLTKSPEVIFFCYIAVVQNLSWVAYCSFKFWWYLSCVEHNLENSDHRLRTMGKVAHGSLPSHRLLVVLGWPAVVLSAGSSDPDRHQSLVGAWWSGLSHEEEGCSHPNKVMLASCHYPLNRQGKKAFLSCDH